MGTGWILTEILDQDSYPGSGSGYWSDRFVGTVGEWWEVYR